MESKQNFFVSLEVTENEFRTTKKCDLPLAKEKVPPYIQRSWALTKITENINLGLLIITVLLVYYQIKYRKRLISNRILQMRNFGLLDLWTKWYQPNPQQFLDTADKMMRQKPSSEKSPPRLSL
jgi:hypothetical protein